MSLSDAYYTVVQARRLSLEWQAYIGRTHAVRKVFASVKGFYFQAEVLGQSVTWLVPHQLAQVCLALSLSMSGLKTCASEPSLSPACRGLLL